MVTPEMLGKSLHASKYGQTASSFAYASTVAGLAEAQALGIVAARSQGPFASVDDLGHRADLNKRSLDLLAWAKALQSLSGHRRLARWDARGVERLPGMLAGLSPREPAIELPQPTEGQDIAADYRSLGLSLGRRPLALLRSRLDRLRVRRAADLPSGPNGRKVRVAGLVTHRQRPETASGVLFVSIEDETGVSNLIVWPRILEEQRTPVLGARLMVVEGELQREQNVIHVIVRQVRDYSAWLGQLVSHPRLHHSSLAIQAQRTNQSGLYRTAPNAAGRRRIQARTTIYRLTRRSSDNE